MTVTMQIILFFTLAAEGALVRLAYLPLSKLKRRVSRRPFDVIADIMLAVIGAAAMFATCFLLAESVRVFYAVFFLGGGVIAHFLLPRGKTENKEE